MRILGIDLGTTTAKTAATLLDSSTGAIERFTVATTTTSLADLLRRVRPDRAVFEVTTLTGMLADLCRELQIPFQAVAADKAWRNRPSKTDRRDADLLARLSLAGQVREVHVPDRRGREWRRLIAFRHTLVRQRTRVKISIKALLRHEEIATKRLWTREGMTALRALACPLSACDGDALWRGILSTQLAQLADVERHLDAVTRQLDAMACADERVQLLTRELPGVGNRVAEAVVALIDQPLRFPNRKAVGAYLGLCPRVSQSGESLRHGGITRAGNPMTRSLLVEVAWLGLRHSPWMRETYQRIRRDDGKRRGTAAVATARRLLVRCWAKLRDHARTPAAAA